MMLCRGLILVTLVLVLGACAAPTPLPGSPQVYAKINSLTDCRELQAEFDRAYSRMEGYSAGSDMWQVLWSYGKTADARMKAVGCYR
jgi:hypothetical protein